VKLLVVMPAVAAVLSGSVATVAWASQPPYYADCDAARAAHAAPIPRGAPGYREALDRDHDGIACEDGDSGSGSVTLPSATPDRQKPKQAPAPQPIQERLPVTH
jgi:hypothetical protein